MGLSVTTLLLEEGHAGTPPFLGKVETNYQTRAGDLDAFIFCMSTGDPNRAPHEQDLLSQWRAYGADGRGACLALATKPFAHYTFHMPGFRINPVIYDRAIQSRLIDEILSSGDALHKSGDPAAVEATVAALVFATPLMKAQGFSEEREWRLIFMPPPPDMPQPEFGFHPRRDFLAPYVTLKHLWHQLRPKLSGYDLLPGPPLGMHELPSAKPLVPATSIMVGPSGHQPLNVRSIQKVIAQAGRSCTHTRSAIPYRSLT